MIDPQVVLSYNFAGTFAEVIFVLILFTLINVAFHIVIAIKQQKTISKQQNMLETKEEFIGLMAAKQHEFNKHIQAINSFAESADYDEEMSLRAVSRIIAYTDDLIERNNSSNERVLYVGDGLLSAYLTKKAAEADEKGIELSILMMDVADKFPCSSTEMIEIIGNMLDNGFEAVEKLPPEDRKVFLEAHDDGRKILIQTMNPVTGTAEAGVAGTKASDAKGEQPIRRGFTTKKGKLHGHGLANIKTIAEKHNGSVQIYSNGEIVTVVVALPKTS